MDIIFNPPDNKANKYIAIMVNPLLESGYRVHSLDSFFSGLRHFRSIKLVHLNWFENLDDTSFAKMISSFFKKSLVLAVIRMSNKKLIWTMHNRVSHEKQSGHLSNILMRKLIRNSNAIIIHCNQSRDLLNDIHPAIASKTHYLPHPDFIDSYGPRVEENGSNGKLKLLFLGAIKPYKNIELLIKSAGQLLDKVELTIAGYPKSTNYKNHLERFAGIFHNIKLRLEFIPDSEIPKLIGSHDLLVLPYDLNSSLNSGTVLLAFSYGKSVICPQIGTLSDMGDVKGQFLSYRYKSDEDHASKLKKIMELAYQKKKDNPEVFKNMGSAMLQYVKKNNGKKLVSDSLKQVYTSVLNS
jgi:glycosyltransferase involved in cell wall biosynthesis